VDSTVKHKEPIFWTSTQPNYSDKDRVRYTMVDGKRIREKVPQRGHVGEYDNYTYAPGVRYVTVLRHDGHIINSVLTNGAGHTDHTGPYGQYIRMKHRGLGWFGMGECPCALVAAQTISRDTLVCEANRDAQPCAPGSYNAKSPCPHAIAERDARRKQHVEAMTEKEHAFKTKDDKLIELLTEHVVKKPEAAPAKKRE